MHPDAPTLLRHLHRLAAPTASDAALLTRWSERHDEGAFAELVSRHGPMVLGVCHRILGDVQHAEDVFQATFLVLADKAAVLRRPDALPGFLYNVALRLARKARAAARRQRTCARPETPEPPDRQPHPLDVLSGRELLAQLDAEVARLPRAYRLPVLLCVLQERSIEEAAQQLGWSVGSVRGRLTRGRERLRDRLTRRGLTLSVGAVALLAPVALPEHLRAATVRNLANPVSPAVRTLAAGLAPALTPRAFALGVLLAVAGLAAALTLGTAPRPQAPAAPTPAGRPAQAPERPRLDRHGDPLPPAALARLGTVRFRVGAEVQTLAYAPDGKTLTVASYAGLSFFDTTSGKQVGHFKRTWSHPEVLLAYSPDGKRLAARLMEQIDKRADWVIRVWELPGGAKSRTYPIHTALWLGWSAAGEPLALSLEPGGLRLHELDAGRSRNFDFPDLPKPQLFNYTVFAATPGARRIAVADQGRRVIHLRDTTADRPRRTLEPKGGILISLALSPDGARLVSITREALQMWDVASGKVLYTREAKDRFRVAQFSPDGKWLAVAAGAWAISFWDAETGKERGRTQRDTDYAPHFAFSPDSKTFATLERHGSAAHLWDVPSGRLRSEPVGHTHRPVGFSFTPDGRRVATGAMDGSVHVWDVGTGEPLIHIKRRDWVRNAVFSADGRQIFSAYTGDQVWISDARTGARLHVLKLEDPDRPDSYQSGLSMRLSADGSTLVAFSSYYAKGQAGPRYGETLITGWDPATRKLLFRRRHPGTEFWGVITSDARVLAVPHPSGDELIGRGIGAGPMRLEDLRTGEPLLTIPAPQGQTWPLAFSPDGRLLAAAAPGNPPPKAPAKGGLRVPERTVRVFEVATAAELLSLPLAYQPRVAFSADGRLLAVADSDRSILVWDLARGREQRRITGFDAEVTSLGFSPDGRRLLSGLGDSTVLVWDVGARAPGTEKLGPEGLARAWADLAGADAARAFRARGALASAPEEAVAWLKGRLKRAAPADAERLRQLLAELGSKRFAVRDKAQAALEGIGDLAEGALRRALADSPTLEVRRRLQGLLARLRGPVTRPEVLRSVRAVAVLEDIATPAARGLLAELAAGAPDARLTREAQASLGRLERRPPAPR
jgi:RNA polymerase sigma factor (sigma-70 family)